MKDFKILDDREHILSRSEMYIGSINYEKYVDFVYEDDKIKYKEFRIIPGLCKIINEVIDNSIDVAIRSNFKYGNEISIKIDNNMVQVKDNGTGIPIVKHEEGYQPYLCWGKAKAGSNFDDTKDHIQMGKFGVGSYCTNVWSYKFIGETDDGNKSYKVTFENNASKYDEKVSKSKKQGTIVTFYPDLERLKIKEIDENHINFIYQRILCLANIFTQIKFTFNNKQIKIKSFKEFAKLFSENTEIYESDNIKIGVLPNDTDDFKHFSFVNGLKIPDGGIHIDLISNQITNIIRDKLIKKYKSIKPADIKNKLTLIVFISNFPNPKFNSQTKEKLTNSQKEFNEFADIDYSFVDKILKNQDIINPIIDYFKIKEEFKNKQELKSATKVKGNLSDIEKYIPATHTKKYLFISEGDSASGAISSIIGRKESGYYTLKGKPLNAYDRSSSEFAKNTELTDLFNIIKAEDYQYIVSATDQDLDGIHITTLLAGFIEKYLPDYKDRFCKINTPIKSVLKNKLPIRWIYSLNENLEYSNSDHVKYYKGLGNWTKETLSVILNKDGLDKMIVKFDFDDPEIINDFLSSEESDKRKEYIRNNEFSIATL